MNYLHGEFGIAEEFINSLASGGIFPAVLMNGGFGGNTARSIWKRV